MALNNENEKKYDDSRRENPESGLNKNTDSNANPHLLPEDDPAVINPDELSTFPREVKNEDPDLEEERDSHLANKVKGSVREGRNITNTDTKPDENGFM